MKRCIFTAYNFQVDPRYPELHARVCDKFKSQDTDYLPLRYDRPDGMVVHWQVLDYALPELFYKSGYDSVLVLDLDCIPLSARALEKTFELAEKDALVGNIQRSNHIENDKHVYVGSSCFALTRSMYEKMGKPSANLTYRADTIEEYTYACEEKDLPVVKYMPKSYEAIPYSINTPWQLADGMPEYGIGTTFVDEDGAEMFYHLFESRYHGNIGKFISKCDTILKP
jgi:hypothetical protein